MTTFRKSTYSGSEANCVEVGDLARRIVVRDTKHRHGPAIEVAPDAWRRFLQGVKRQS